MRSTKAAFILLLVVASQAPSASQPGAGIQAASLEGKDTDCCSSAGQQLLPPDISRGNSTVGASNIVVSARNWPDVLASPHQVARPHVAGGGRELNGALPPGEFEACGCFFEVGSTGVLSRTGGELCKGPACQSISLGALGISAIAPGTFRGMVHLQYLDLAQNKLVRIAHDDIKDVKTLKPLVLSRNEIASIAPGTFAGLPRLSAVHMQSNMLESVTDRTFDGLQGSIEVINLSYNRITSVSPGAFSRGFWRLDHINLASNRLMVLPLCVFSNIHPSHRPTTDRGVSERGKSYSVAGNPLLCLPLIPNEGRLIVEPSLFLLPLCHPEQEALSHAGSKVCAPHITPQLLVAAFCLPTCLPSCFLGRHGFPALARLRCSKSCPTPPLCRR